MENIKLYLHYIIHVLLAAAIVLLLLVKPCVKVNVPTAPDRPIIHDTVYLDSIIYVSVPIPQPITKLVTIFDTVYQDNIIYVDTSSYKANYYQDSIDTQHGIIRWYAATTGLLLGLDAEYEGQIREIVKYKDRETIKYKTGLYLTSGIGYNFDSNASADIGLSIMTKKGRIYGYEYDFLNNFHKIKTGLRLF